MLQGFEWENDYVKSDMQIKILYIRDWDMEWVFDDDFPKLRVILIETSKPLYFLFLFIKSHMQQKLDHTINDIV
jgi:hypothetical protein